MAASASHFSALSLDQVLEDLSSRFIVNLPQEELDSIERICFQIEQAHWFYEDFIRPQASHLPSYSLRKFSELVFKTNPLLSHYNPIDSYDHFLRYKERVPVCGAIILSASWQKCLLVKGWKSSASWSFPRGKINQGETERDCAVREVWEETGYDISPHFDPTVTPHPIHSQTCPPPLPRSDYPDDDFIEIMMKEQKIRLYVVPGVHEDTLFETKTRKEISSIAWAPLADLPTWSKKNKGGKKELKCYMVTPFVGPLRSWIAARKGSKKVPTSKPVAAPLEQELDAAIHRDEQIEDPLHDHQTQDQAQHLAATSQALQTLFFGSGPAKPQTSTLSFEPTTVSPKPVSTSTFPGAVASPRPQASPSNKSALLGILSGSSPLAPSTTSPVSATTGAASTRTLYTEDQREQARGTLLQRLAEQLGTPTPPSPEEPDTSRTPSRNGDPEESQSPVHDLLDIFRAQTIHDGRQLGNMPLTQAVMRSIEDENTRKRLADTSGEHSNGFTSAADPFLSFEQPGAPHPSALTSAHDYRTGQPQISFSSAYTAVPNIQHQQVQAGQHFSPPAPGLSHQVGLLNLLQQAPAASEKRPAQYDSHHQQGPPHSQTLLSMFNSKSLQDNTRLNEFNSYVAQDRAQADLAKLFANAAGAT